MAAAATTRRPGSVTAAVLVVVGPSMFVSPSMLVGNDVPGLHGVEQSIDPSDDVVELGAAALEVSDLLLLERDDLVLELVDVVSGERWTPVDFTDPMIGKYLLEQESSAFWDHPTFFVVLYGPTGDTQEIGKPRLRDAMLLPEVLDLGWTDFHDIFTKLGHGSEPRCRRGGAHVPGSWLFAARCCKIFVKRCRLGRRDGAGISCEHRAG